MVMAYMPRAMHDPSERSLSWGVVHCPQPQVVHEDSIARYDIHRQCETASPLLGAAVSVSAPFYCKLLEELSDVVLVR